MISRQRKFIITTYAAWTALSALRSGSPVKSRKVIYPLIRSINFDAVLKGNDPINEEEFNQWHKQTIRALCEQEPLLCVGWSAKIVNVWLKTSVYVGELGRPNLRNVIHPPVDGGLWHGIEKHSWNDQNIVKLTRTVRSIKAITDYHTYSLIIGGCRLAANELACSLIEIDETL